MCINNDTCVRIKSYEKHQKRELIITAGITPDLGLYRKEPPKTEL